MINRNTWAKVALGAVMGAMLIVPITGAYAQQQMSEQVRVTVNLKDVDLLQATQQLTKLSGLQFMVMPTATPFNKVTLQLSDMPAEDVLRYMCQAAGAEFRRDENGVYVIGRSLEKKPENNLAEPPIPAKKIRKKVRIMKADPKALYQLLVFNQQTDPLQGYRDLNALNELATPPAGRWFGGDNPYGPKIGGASSMPSTPVSTTHFANPNESSNGITLPGESAAQVGAGGGGGGGLPGQGGGAGQNGQNGTTSLAGGQGLIPQGIDFISYDPTDNSFIVQGTDDAVQEFIRLLNEFDVAPKQVTIKVEFITTSSSLSKSLGFEFLYSRGSVSTGTAPGTFIRATDPIFLNYGIGNVTARLRAQLLKGDGKVVNSPIIRTLNNQPATIQNNVSTVIFINQLVGNGAGSVIISPQPFPLQVSTTLAVAPRINNDGTITMTLRPTIADFGQLRRGPDGQEIPDQLSQSINVVARVRNGETIVLGGLTRKSDQGSEARVPILGDLPIIGQFFRSTTRDRNNSELLIFVTPTVVEDDEGNGINP